VDICSKTKFEGGVENLHKAKSNAVVEMDVG